MKKTIVTFCILCSTIVYSQIGICFYPINNTLGIKTSNLKSLSFEMRMSYGASNSTADILYIIQPEANFIYRIRKEERVNFYSGLGGGYTINNANGNFISSSILLGCEFYPMINMKNFNITAEIDPGARFFEGYQTLKLSGWLGLTYYFSKRS